MDTEKGRLLCVEEIIREIQRTEFDIQSRKELIYHSVLDGNFEQAVKKAEQVHELSKELIHYRNQFVSFKGIGYDEV